MISATGRTTHPTERDEMRRVSSRLSSHTLPGWVSGMAASGAAEEIEAWVLALLGERDSESHADAKRVLAKAHGIDNRHSKIEAVRAANIDRVPEDARSLKQWRERARNALAPQG